MAYLRYGHTVTLKGGFLRGQWLQLKVTILRINFTKFLVHTTETSFSVFSCDIFKLFKLTEKQIAPGSLPIPNTLRVSHIQYKLCKETLKKGLHTKSHSKFLSIMIKATQNRNKTKNRVSVLPPIGTVAV